MSLNEVEKENGYNDDADEPAVLESALESRTGSPWYACFAQLLMGDFNASPGAAEVERLRTGWDDAWAAAVTAGTAVSYPGNTAGNTRNSRIDDPRQSSVEYEMSTAGAAFRHRTY